MNHEVLKYLSPAGGDRLSSDRIRTMQNDPVGEKLLQKMSSLISGDLFSKQMPVEIFEEAQVLVLMDENHGLTNDEKIELLNRKQWRQMGVSVQEGILNVSIMSTVAPECDQFFAWEG